MALEIKNLLANTGDIREAGSIPGSGRSSGGGHGNPLQYSCLENPMDRGVGQATVHGVAESDMTKHLSLIDFGHLIQRTDSLEKTLMLGKTKGGRKRG